MAQGKPNPFGRYMGLGLTFVGLALLAGAYFSWQGARQTAHSGVQRTGVVLRILEQETAEGLIQEAPVVVFQTAEGDSITFRHDSWQTELELEVGDSVPVVYQKGRSQQAKIKQTPMLFWVPKLLLGIGGVFTVLGMYLNVRHSNY